MTVSDGGDDAQLARRAANGEDQAFTLLMRRHQAGLFTFARRHVGDADAAADIVQETFVSAWKALKRFDAARSFPVWLRAIALNKCRDRGRRRAVRRLVFGDRDLESPEAQRQADPAPGGEQALLSSRRRAALEAAIARLPASLKEPLILTWLEDFSQQQAADLLGVSVKAVETRVYRARRKLGEWLSDDDI
ncbi:RNA polymerase sigma factor [Caulobacter sp. LARHSG274]